MTLHYLSGDDVGKSAKGKARQEKRQTKKAEVKAKKKIVKAAPKGQKKAARKDLREARGGGILKKVAKLNVAPVRIAFLGLVEINMLKLATKLAKAWKANPEKVKAFWKKFGGDEAKFKAAIARGAKTTLSGAEVGNPAAVLAAATPILIAVAKLFKELKVKDEGTGGSEAELLKSIDEGKQTLLDNPEVDKGTVTMNEEDEVAKIKTKEAQTDEMNIPDLGSFQTGTIETKTDLLNFIRAAMVFQLGFLLTFGNNKTSFIICNLLIFASLIYAFRKQLYIFKNLVKTFKF